MIFNTITNIESCYIDIPSLIYYSHIPTVIIALLMGFFVYMKNRQAISGKILFLIAISFALWTSGSLITWLGHDSSIIMLVWSFFVMLEILIFALCLYFVYVFIDGESVSFMKKIAIFSFLLPAVFLTPTSLNIPSFDLVNCESSEGMLVRYGYIVEAIFSFWIFLVCMMRFRKEQNYEMRKKIIYLAVGVLFFLLSFFWANSLASFTLNWSISEYGFFGMTFFMGMLAFLIVRFKAFDIKLLGVQALVVSLVILIGSQFFFIQNNTNRILTGITLVLSGVAGWFLVKSSKKLDERKEQLQIMAAKLSTANDQLRTLDNAKTEFISIASHQLRTPLTAIKGFISMLLEGSYGKLVPQQEDVLNKVYSSNERLVNLVEDLLNVSRMESGRMEFKFAPWDMDKICQEVIDTFALRAKSCKLDLTYVKPETVLPELLIDGVKVREVISNLTDNAIKYTLEGHGGVTLKLEQLGENIRVTVSDTGIGIPETELPYLFAKFSRGKDISRLNTGGTGLGLYVGKSMIENNGGRIWAESDGQGLGSRFIIELPIKQSEELIKKWG